MRFTNAAYYNYTNYYHMHDISMISSSAEFLYNTIAPCELYLIIYVPSNWYGMVRHGTARYGMVRHGMATTLIIITIDIPQFTAAIHMHTVCSVKAILCTTIAFSKITNDPIISLIIQCRSQI